MNLNNKSKQLAYLLRHDREYEFDNNGWRKVSDLICNHGFTLDVLQDIVNTNNKQRYEFSYTSTTRAFDTCGCGVR